MADDAPCEARMALSAELDLIGNLVAGATALLGNELDSEPATHAEGILKLAQGRLSRLTEQLHGAPPAAGLAE